MSAFTSTQRHHAIGLYKRLIRTASETFAGDVNAVAAWRAKVRQEFLAARQESDTEKIEQGLATWEDVVRVLRHNVVQGKMNEERNAFKLQFTKDTELGSNESIRAGRQKQLDDLRASKGSAAGLGCGSSATISSGSSSASSSSVRPHTSIRSFSTSATYQKNATISATKPTDVDGAWNKQALPRPVPHFGQTVVLSDGSTILLSTTSPRGTIRTTRDPTNHPLFNPHLAGRGGAGEEDESGRLARFRKRFGGMQDAASQAAPEVSMSEKSSATGAKSVAKSAKRAAAANVAQSAGFSQEDFSWMTGGHEAPPGQVVKEKKGRK